MAILWGIQQFRPYLEGYHFTVYSYHKRKNPTGILAPWGLLLQEYSFTLSHRKGIEHKVPDALSRIPPNSLDARQNDLPHCCLVQQIEWSNIKEQWYKDKKQKVMGNPLEMALFACGR